MMLIDDASRWYKLHSVQLAMVAGPAIGWAVEHPDKVRDFLASIHASPGLLGLVAWALGTGVPLYFRLRAQPCPPASDGTDHAGA